MMGRKESNQTNKKFMTDICKQEINAMKKHFQVHKCISGAQMDTMGLKD